MVVPGSWLQLRSLWFGWQGEGKGRKFSSRVVFARAWEGVGDIDLRRDEFETEICNGNDLALCQHQQRVA